jgi:hypothetical protein
MNLVNAEQQEMMKRYLYQEMSAAERTSVEEQFFLDENYFYDLLDLENQLIDSYARHTLGAEEIVRFERSLRLLPERREKLNRAIALHRLINAQKEDPTMKEQIRPPASEVGRRSSWRETLHKLLPHPTLAFTYALAGLLIMSIIASAWFFGDARRTSIELARARETQALYEEQLRQLNHELNEERKRNIELTAKIPEPKKEEQSPAPLQRAVEKIPVVVRAPGVYQSKGASAGGSGSSHVQPNGPIRIASNTTSVALTLAMFNRPLSAEEAQHLQFDLIKNARVQPIVPLTTSLSKQGLLIISLPAKNLFNGAQVLRIKYFGDTVGDYDLQINRR